MYPEMRFYSLKKNLIIKKIYIHKCMYNIKKNLRSPNKDKIEKNIDKIHGSSRNFRDGRTDV